MSPVQQVPSATTNQAVSPAAINFNKEAPKLIDQFKGNAQLTLLHSRFLSPLFDGKQQITKETAANKFQKALSSLYQQTKQNHYSFASPNSTELKAFNSLIDLYTTGTSAHKPTITKEAATIIKQMLKEYVDNTLPVYKSEAEKTAAAAQAGTVNANGPRTGIYFVYTTGKDGKVTDESKVAQDKAQNDNIKSLFNSHVKGTGNTLATRAQAFIQGLRGQGGFNKLSEGNYADFIKTCVASKKALPGVVTPAKTQEMANMLTDILKAYQAPDAVMKRIPEFAKDLASGN